MPTALPTPEAPPNEQPAEQLPQQLDPSARLHELLNRTAEERLREYKYRFAQSVVFGLPVVALQWWGSALGPIDADRWVSLIQALMCGWVLYVNLGMLVEGILIPRLSSTSAVESCLRRDFLVASCATALYLSSLVSALHGIITAHLWYRPLLFHICVIVLAAWTGWRWMRLSRAR
jgi:hypothetical protein